MTAISVVILTYNEEINIRDCIESCGWSDDIVVFDSLSDDRTRAIALECGARVVERTFDNYAAQRSAALTQVSYRNSWVLMVDADERTPADLVEEMRAAIERADADTVLFFVRRRDYFLGRWLRRSSGYPTWFGRLMRPGRVRIEREVNEEYLADGKVGRLRSHLLHYPFSKGITYWFERHNRYSTMEAAAHSRIRTTPISLGALLSSDPQLRRRSLKRLAYRLPMRPLLVFVYLYIVRLGFLDGRAGFAFTRMRASYELLIDLKMMEIERRAHGAAL